MAGIVFYFVPFFQEVLELTVINFRVLFLFVYYFICLSLTID